MAEGLGDAAAQVEQPNEAVRDLFGPAFGDIRRFARMITAEGELRGLIGPRELPRLWSRHIVNSMAISEFIPEELQVLDIGSGAGFPGLVLAIARPDLDVHLVEPMERRCEWLDDVADALKLGNVTIHHARAEEMRGLGLADIVTARAVANLKKLLPLAMPLVQPGGSLLALKGRRARDEVTQARSIFARNAVADARVYEVPSVMEDESTMVVEVIKKRDQRRQR